MAKVLSAISLDSPAAPVTADVNDTFSFAGTPSFTGGGGVQRYDWKWEVDSGGGFVTIGSSGTGLITADTNPLANSNSQTQNSITVTCDAAGSYTIRMAGAPATGGSYTVLSSTQTAEVSEAAGTDELLANDVESASEVTNPAVGQTHVLTANDVQSTSEVGAPSVGQVHALAANDAESASEVSSPAIALVTPLNANDVESASEVTSPAIGQVHALAADDAQSATEVTAPSAGQVHGLLANDVESASAVSVPALAQVHALLANDTQSASEVSNPTLEEDGGNPGESPKKKRRLPSMTYRSMVRWGQGTEGAAMRRYIKDIFDGQYKWVEDSGGVVRFGEKKPNLRGPYIVPDIEPFISPIDGKVVDGRAAKREHMRRHDVEEVGNERLKPHKYEPMPQAAPDVAQVMRERGDRLA